MDRALGVRIGDSSALRSTNAALEPFDIRLKIIERDRSRAQALSSDFPQYEILHGDATDFSLLQAERIERAGTFVALTGHDPEPRRDAV